MPRRPRPLPASLGPHFSVAEARAAGVSQRRLRNPDLERSFTGTRSRPAAASDASSNTDAAADRSPLAVKAERARAGILRRARAYAPVMGAHAFFFGVTAAALWGPPLPYRVLRAITKGNGKTHERDRPLDVATSPPHRASRARGLTARQLSPRLTDVGELDGLRIASPSTVWAQLAAELTVDELIAAGDAIVQPKRGEDGTRDPASALSTLEGLENAMNAGRRTGVEKLREALPQIRVGSDSSAETDLRLAILRAGLPEPVLDYTIVDARGRTIGYTEMAYPAWRLLIEYEGDHHRTDRAQWQRDIDKHAACAELGWTVLRLTSGNVYPNRRPALDRIRSALMRAGWRP